MPTSLYDLIIPSFIKGLQTFDHVLTQAEKYAKEKGFNADEVFPQARLIDDQKPLVFQVQTATRAVQTTIGRLTGVEPIFFEDNEKTIADLHARIQRALEAVKNVKPEDVNSREDVKVELPRPDKVLHLTVKEATLYHGQTNFFFHIVTGYSIIRSKGVPIGKADYLGSFLAQLYRSRSLMQSYNLMRADVPAATSGTQSISYELDYPLVRQRIDRRIQPSRESIIFWSKAVMEWIKKNIGKKVAYVAPSHHHRDHSGGVVDYVRAGTKLIIPEMAVDYWSSIPGAQFIIFNQTHPYDHRDNKVQAWFNWADQAPCVADWTYVIVTERCPDTNSSVFIYEAGTWKAGLSADLGNQQQMRQWLDQLLEDGLPRSSTVMPMHVWILLLEQLINITAYPYLELEEGCSVV
ncbi:hypothetical protein F52700_5227 [Fusarium sp. NRRL 52700]|nr:hypothetical protein F52700_5227 [Fusarium sp. NRRL 52700]